MVSATSALLTARSSLLRVARLLGEAAAMAAREEMTRLKKRMMSGGVEDLRVVVG